MELISALGIVRLLIQAGVSRDAAVENPAIPKELRNAIIQAMDEENSFILRPAAVISSDSRAAWLHHIDRSSWYYWPRLRDHLLGTKNRSAQVVRSIDEATDRVLEHLASPDESSFDIRGLVIGYVQSGKTANYTALVAKCADLGYRLVVVLTGMDKGLRRQTQIRIKTEVVGYSDNRPSAVRLPPVGRQWHEFTSDEMEGDFQPGNANQAALQGSHPVLLVIKKNGPVLRKLLAWLEGASDQAKSTLPAIFIDDEADQASIDTRGSYQLEGVPVPTDYEEPSVINGLIRQLLQVFQRRCYVAYTATPYANVLIPHDTFDPRLRNDLYPKDFIIDLPKPPGYFGAEDLFGKLDPNTNTYTDGLDVIEDVVSGDIVLLDQGTLPPSLLAAIDAFVLAAAGRSARGMQAEAATMLVHISHLKVEQNVLANLVRQRYFEIRDEWRYQRKGGIRERWRAVWDKQFRPLTAALHIEKDVDFDVVEPFISPILEAIEVKVINSDTGEVLDYERQPDLKAIAIGGNRLSRGLTLEGLLVSYFTRSSETYDTLMQMGRWFGFRGGYEDLTRIWTTTDLQTWFADLSFVESQLRQDIRIYEELELKPADVGLRIWQHPAMQITNKLKRRFSGAASSTQFAGSLQQTFKFPLTTLENLPLVVEPSRLAVIKLINDLDAPVWTAKGPQWTSDRPDLILSFLGQYRTDAAATGVSLSDISAYIRSEVAAGRLLSWDVAVRGREQADSNLGDVDWGCFATPIHQIERTRIGSTNSLGVITSPGDEAVGLSDGEMSTMQRHIDAGKSENIAARLSRPSTRGLLLIYPISRQSGRRASSRSIRRPLFADPNDVCARDLIAIAISFPASGQRPQLPFAVGTAGWLPST